MTGGGGCVVAGGAVDGGSVTGGIVGSGAAVEGAAVEGAAVDGVGAVLDELGAVVPVPPGLVVLVEPDPPEPPDPPDVVAVGLAVVGVGRDGVVVRGGLLTVALPDGPLGLPAESSR